MKLSAKARYALAALAYMARLQPKGPDAPGCEAVTLVRISERLGISKIYLEQTFSLLRRAGLVTSVKGAQGGYFLARQPEKMSAMDILSAIDRSLFEETEHTVQASSPDLDRAMKKTVFTPLDDAVRGVLSSVSLADLARQAEQEQAESGYMFFI